jgi:signal peptidase II
LPEFITQALRSKKWRLVLAVCVSLFAADRLTKEVTRYYLEDAGYGVRVLRGFLYVRWDTNDAGFLDALEQIPPHVSVWVFVIASAAFAAFLVHLLRVRTNDAEIQAISLTLGGVLGNGFDRVVYGHVIDCALLVSPWRTSFNIADIAIFVGITWLILINSGLSKKPTESV